MAKLLKDGSILMRDGRVLWGRDPIQLIDLRELSELLVPGATAFPFLGGGRGPAGPAGPPGSEGTDVGCRLTHSVNQVAAAGTVTTMAFDTEFYDVGDLHSNIVNNHRITFPTTGKYAFGACLQTLAKAAGVIALNFGRSNGADMGAQGGEATAVSGDAMSASSEGSFAAGDFIFVYLNNTTVSPITVIGLGGGSTEDSPVFWARKVDKAG